MRKYLLSALAAAAALTVVTPADARDGCGRGGHRGPYGHCRPNGGPGYGYGHGRPVIGTYYRDRGWYDGRRYYQHRYRWHNGWRYR